jgi:hypothetical protein
VDTPGIECWRARWTDDRGWAFQNWDTGRTLRATAPARTGGRPVPPPERGAPVYLIDGLDDGLRYSLWALQPQTLRDKYALQANNCLPTDTPMVLNVKGNDWEMQTAEMITWEWSGGQPNEIWWFQELHPQPTPQWD